MAEISPGTAEDIAAEVRISGSTDVDWNLLANAWFHGDVEKRLNEWCEARGFKWARFDTRTGRLMGPVVVFSRRE